MTDLDAHHWTQIAGRTKIHEVPGYLRVKKGTHTEPAQERRMKRNDTILSD